MNGRYWIYIYIYMYLQNIRYIGYIVHTGNIPSVKWKQLDKKNKKSRGWGESRDFSGWFNSKVRFCENIIPSRGLCCHFALGIFSKTYRENAVFDVNIRQQKLAKISNIQKCQIWHKSNITNLIGPSYSLSRLRHVKLN